MVPWKFLHPAPRATTPAQSLTARFGPPEKLPFHPIGSRIVFLSHPFSGAFAVKLRGCNGWNPKKLMVSLFVDVPSFFKLGIFSGEPADS